MQCSLLHLTNHHRCWCHHTQDTVEYNNPGIDEGQCLCNLEHTLVLCKYMALFQYCVCYDIWHNWHLKMFKYVHQLTHNIQTHKRRVICLHFFPINYHSFSTLEIVLSSLLADVTIFFYLTSTHRQASYQKREYSKCDHHILPNWSEIKVSSAYLILTQFSFSLL